MKNAGRMAAVLLVLIVSAVLLYPSIKWYCFVSEDLKQLAVGSKEQIRDYSRARAGEDVARITSLGGSAAVPGEFSYLVDVAKEREGIQSPVTLHPSWGPSKARRIFSPSSRATGGT